jgi:hypothetical protein
MDKTLLNEVAAAFAAIDFSDQNARIAAIEEERAKIATAVEAAEARCTEIARLVYETKKDRADAIADALLVEGKASAALTAAPSREALDDERASLRAGITKLHHRAQDLHDEIKAIQSGSFHALAPTAERLVDAYLTIAQQGAEMIVEAYAALDALNFATHAGMTEVNRLKGAVAGFTGQGGLLSWRRTFDVPKQVDEVLRALEGKGPALPVRFTRTAVAP